MTDDKFWVDTEGLKDSASGFHAKGTYIKNLATRIQHLMDTSSAAALGNDQEGREMWKKIEAGAQDLYAGVNSWGTAVYQTGDAIVSSAKVFAATEENNIARARALTGGTTEAADVSVGQDIATPTTPTIGDSSGSSGSSNTSTNPGRH